jgi:Ca2+-binding EF-hand superfamily protein
LTKENLEITFKTLDLDNSGTISTGELRQVFEASGHHNTDDFWAKFVEKVD